MDLSGRRAVAVRSFLSGCSAAAASAATAGVAGDATATRRHLGKEVDPRRAGRSCSTSRYSVGEHESRAAAGALPDGDTRTTPPACSGSQRRSTRPGHPPLALPAGRGSVIVTAASQIVERHPMPLPPHSRYAVERRSSWLTTPDQARTEWTIAWRRRSSVRPSEFRRICRPSRAAATCASGPLAAGALFALPSGRHDCSAWQSPGARPGPSAAAPPGLRAL